MKTLVILCCFSPLFVTAQVHLKNQQFLQLNLGSYDSFLPKGGSFSANLEWGKYNKKLNSRIFGLEIQYKNADAYSTELLGFRIPVIQYYGFFKTDVGLYQYATKIFHIKGTGQINIGYESINKESKFLNDYTLAKSSEYLLGVGVGLQIEYCPFIVGLTENINFLSNYQKLNTVPYIGFRYHFY